MRLFLIAILTLLFSAAGILVTLAGSRILVFAPSSMTEVMEDLVQAFNDSSEEQAVLSLAGTPQLARQLDAGALADIFITADRRWMDWAAERKLIIKDKISALAENRLVLATGVEVENWADIDGLLTEGRFAMAEPESVPAGRYAKQALQSRDVWEKAKSRAVFGDNVRTTILRLVRGEVTTAIVYGTDVIVEPNVRVLFTFPEKSHDPIVYWVAPVREGKSSNTVDFINYLRGPAAGQIFAKAGFTLPKLRINTGENQ